jgi:hypothetical protein
MYSTRIDDSDKSKFTFLGGRVKNLYVQFGEEEKQHLKLPRVDVGETQYA